MKRLDKLLNHIREIGCDGCVITDRKNVRYLSGFTGSYGYLIISENRKILVTDFRYIEQASKQTNEFEIVNVAKFNLKKYAEAFNTTAFEDDSVSYKEYLNLKKSFSRLKGLGNFMMELRSVKEAEEIENIRKAEKIGDDAFSYVLGIIRAGITEKELAREIDFYMLSHGAEALSFDTIVASGARGSMPHAYPTDAELKNGDLVVMDFGCVYNGYCSDMTRTIGLGSVSDECSEAYHTVLSAQKSALNKIEAGVGCDSVHNIAFNIIDDKYKGLFGHALGHGVGLDIHEQPVFGPKSQYPLPKSAVISVEPGVYIPEKCGVRIEDLVLVTDSGYENLTSSPKDLIII